MTKYPFSEQMKSEPKISKPRYLRGYVSQSKLNRIKSYKENGHINSQKAFRCYYHLGDTTKFIPPGRTAECSNQVNQICRLYQDSTGAVEGIQKVSLADEVNQALLCFFTTPCFSSTTEFDDSESIGQRDKYYLALA